MLAAVDVLRCLMPLRDKISIVISLLAITLSLLTAAFNLALLVVYH